MFCKRMHLLSSSCSLCQTSQKLGQDLTTSGRSLSISEIIVVYCTCIIPVPRMASWLTGVSHEAILGTGMISLSPLTSPSCLCCSSGNSKQALRCRTCKIAAHLWCTSELSQQLCHGKVRLGPALATICTITMQQDTWTTLTTACTSTMH